MKTKFLGFLFFILILFPAQLFSQNTAGSATTTETINEADLPIGGVVGEESPTSNRRGGFSLFLDFLRMIFVLAVVLAMIYFFFVLLKKMGKPAETPGSAIKIVESKNLSGSRFLHIVEIGKEFFVLSSTDNSIQLLSKIEDKETIDLLSLEKERLSEVDNKSFREKLAEVAGFRGKNGDIGKKVSESLNFFQKQKERLKKM